MTVRIGQLGTRHGHAAGKWAALCCHPEVEAVGIWEPDASLRGRGYFPGAHWLTSVDELLNDAGVVAVAVEGRNHESLAMAAMAVDAGKHVWFDKPAGDDWPAFQKLMAQAVRRNLHVQMGYMFRYSPGFTQLSEWVKSGLLGNVFAIRAHMSTNVDLVERGEQSRHLGGVLYDLGGHMLDQIVWLLGRPASVSSVLRNDATPDLPTYSDNTMTILQFEHALAVLDIAAMEPRPAARRFEVYGTRGSAILEPFDPARTIRLALEEPTGAYAAGATVFTLEDVPRQQLYERELQAFVKVAGPAERSGAWVLGRAGDRSPEHELLVQETLLRATGRL